MLSDYSDINLSSNLTAEQMEADDKTGSKPLQCVRVDGLVVLKILQHAHACQPESVFGQCLGVGHGNVLEVTHCFPLLTKDEDSPSKEQEEYTTRFQEHLQKVNADVLVIGWYIISTNETHCTAPNFLDTMHLYQSQLGEHSVCLLIDPLRSLHGKLYMKALRLKPEFMKMYTENKDKRDFSQMIINNFQVTSADIFQEVPITIDNCHLIDMFLWELGNSSEFTSMTTEENIVAVERSLTGYQTLSAAAMVEQTESVLTELREYLIASRQRKNEEGGSREAKPSRLETVSLSHQLNALSRHVCDISQVGFESVSLCEALQQAQTASH